MTKKHVATILGLIISIGCGVQKSANASDHDDGSQALSQNNLNLTDLFVFREDNQTGQSADQKNLILIMDSNGHTPAGKQVFFNTNGRYDFHLTRVAGNVINTAPTGKDDVILRFQFGEPDANQHQSFTLTAIRDGQVIAGNTAMTTTSMADGKAALLTENKIMLGDSELTVFAGLREDPFFFDVEQFLKVRAGAAGLGPKATFRTPDKAVDGFHNQNVNSIVVRVPIGFLQTSANEPIFDVWETTSLK